MAGKNIGKDEPMNRGVIERLKDRKEFAESQTKRATIVGESRAAQQTQEDFRAPTAKARTKLAVKRVGEYKRKKRK
jgi:hypothetical protein